MPYDCQTDMVQILRATLAVLENSEYKGKDSKAVAELTFCLRDAIPKLEALSHTPPRHTLDS